MSCLRANVPAVLFLFVAILGRAQSDLVNLSVAETKDGPVFVVTNHNTPAITSFLVTAPSLTKSGKPLTRFYFDTYVNYRRDYPIVTRDSEQMPLPHVAGRPAPQPILRAVIFEDGSSWGEASWVDELLQRRALALRALNNIDRILEAAATQNLSRENLLDALQQERAREAAVNPGLRPEDGVLLDSVFQTAIANLSGGMQGNGKIPKVSEAIFYLKHMLNSWRGQLQSAKPSPPPRAGFPAPLESGAPPERACKSNADCDGGGWCSAGECRLPEGCCPILIALGPRPDVQLTPPNAGVWFDLQGSGKRYRVAWTTPGEPTAFLVRDGNNNGTIDDGSELLGNYTPLPGGGMAPTGFDALAAYDLSANGGNGDGWIDSLDAIWPQLRLWIDLNHNGLSESGEIHESNEYALSRISLDYLRLDRRDEYGNVVRHKSKCQLAGKIRFGYDVHFASRPPATPPPSH